MVRVPHVLLIAGLSLGGCAQVFGIDVTSGSGAGDAGGGSASLAMQRVSVGVTAIRAPLDITGLSASFLTPTRVPAPQTGTNTWSADVVGAPPIEFELPDDPAPIPRIFAFGQRTLLGDFEVLEDPSPQDAPVGAAFQINVALGAPYAGEGLQMLTVGAWSQLEFSGAQLPAVNQTTLAPASPIMYSTFSPVGNLALHQITTADAVLILKYASGKLTGALDATTFNQTTGTNMITGTMAAVTADQMTTATLDPTMIPGRYSQIRPVLGAVSMAWAITATPASSIAGNAGPILNTGNVTAMQSTITAPYGNPFSTTRNWSPVFLFQTGASRSFTPAGSTASVTLSAGLSELDDAASTLSLGLAAGMPTMVTLNQTALVTDGMTVTIDVTQPVQIGFTTDQPTNTFYQVQLTEIAAGATAGSIVETARLIANGLQPAFAVPSDYFVSGHTYVLRAEAIQGSAPNAAMGDLQTRQLPLAFGFADSAVFTVQ